MVHCEPRQQQIALYVYSWESDDLTLHAVIVHVPEQDNLAGGEGDIFTGGQSNKYSSSELRLNRTRQKE